MILPLPTSPSSNEYAKAVEAKQVGTLDVDLVDMHTSHRLALMKTLTQ